jgi:hypothetical protein
MFVGQMTVGRSVEKGPIVVLLTRMSNKDLILTA